MSTGSLTADVASGDRTPINVGYLLSRFPKLSETFVLNEIMAVERTGIRQRTYSLFGVSESVMHGEARRLRGTTRYASFWSRRAVAAHVRCITSSPRAYLSVLWAILRGTATAPMTLAKTLVVLPKAIYFARAMRDDGVDHIHAHFATHATTAAWIIHRLTGIPYTFTVHAHDLFVDKHLLREKVAEAAAVVAISEFNKQILVAHCGAESAAKISVIHCGADLELFRPSVRTGIDGPFEIVCVGTLEEKKGQTHLIDACRLLRAEGVSFRCTLVGDGPRRGLLEEQTRNAGLEGAVIFTGALPRDGVAEMVSRADVVVLPSIRAKSGMMEGIPVSLMEAMACGVPVVSTRLSGIPELVGDGATGLLVEPENASALARALRKLYRSPCLRSRMGRAGRDVVLAEFDLGANANRLAMLIRSCCRQPSARTGAVCRSEPAVGTLGIEKGLGI